VLLSLTAVAPVAAQTQKRAAQKPERGYVSVSGGAQVPAGTLRERFTYTLNAEEATTEATYPSKAGIQFDAGAGMHMTRRLGVAVHVSRSSSAGNARTSSQLPHPLLDNQDRQVEGDARDLSRDETAAHVQLYYFRKSGRWLIRLAGGPSYFRVAQQVVTGITVDEEYPFDTATFRSATTARARGSAPGFNAGVDLSRMLTRRLAANAMVRFSRGTLDVDAGNARRVATKAGGAQAGAGIRVSF
jgi:hypothetical protein